MGSGRACMFRIARGMGRFLGEGLREMNTLAA
jgi:hypothetical protein